MGTGEAYWLCGGIGMPNAWENHYHQTPCWLKPYLQIDIVLPEIFHIHVHQSSCLLPHHACYVRNNEITCNG